MMYTNTEAQILHKGILSDPVTIKSGVRQGCPLSPLLFNITIDEVMRKVNNNSSGGINWYLTQKLEDLDYADDISLLAQTHEDLQRRINKLAKCAAEVGLEININKTKVMRGNTNNTRPITIGDTSIEDVDKFNYLGSVITKEGGTKDDIDNKLMKARATFGRMWKIWRSSQIAKKTKLRIFQACIKSVLLYGSETWLVNKKEMYKLQVFVNKCLRIICRIHWPRRIRNEDLWEATGQEPIEKTIKKRKYRWIGHVLRRSPNCIARQALEWNPQGKRNVGRPKNTWRRTVEREITQLNKTWSQMKVIAQNRNRWKRFVEALCPMSRKEKKNV